MSLKKRLGFLLIAVTIFPSAGFFAGAAEAPIPTHFASGSALPAQTEQSVDVGVIIGLRMDGQNDVYQVVCVGPMGFINDRITSLNLIGWLPQLGLFQLRLRRDMESGLVDDCLMVYPEIFIQRLDFRRLTCNAIQLCPYEFKDQALSQPGNPFACGRMYGMPPPPPPPPPPDPPCEPTDDQGNPVGISLLSFLLYMCQPVLFSVAAGGPSGLDPASLYAPGPVLVVSGASLGLVPGDDLDAASDGRESTPQGFEFFPRFSVGPTSRGLTGTAVRIESDCSEGPADEFGLKPFGVNDSPCAGSGFGSGRNFLCYDQSPATCGLQTPENLRLAIDEDVDALIEASGPVPKVFFSLTPDSPTLAALGAGPADILMSSPGGTPMIYARAMDLGLRSRDDMDGLCLMEDGDGIYNKERDRVHFSLRRGSPGLGPAISAADILAPGPMVVIPASTSGLGPRDDLDAIKCRLSP